MHLFTDSKVALREAVTRKSARLSLCELIVGGSAYHTQKELIAKMVRVSIGRTEVYGHAKGPSKKEDRDREIPDASWERWVRAPDLRNHLDKVFSAQQLFRELDPTSNQLGAIAYTADSKPLLVNFTNILYRNHNFNDELPILRSEKAAVKFQLDVGGVRPLFAKSLADFEM